MWRMFRKEREEAEARKAMAGLDKLTTPGPPPRTGVQLDFVGMDARCVRCDIPLVMPHDKMHTLQCPRCGLIMRFVVEGPDPNG